MNPIRDRVNFWISKNKRYRAVFEDIKVFPGLVRIAESIIQVRFISKTESEDFVDGLVYCHWALTKGDEELGRFGDKLVMPLMKEVINYMSSDHYQKLLIKRKVYGNEKLPISVPEVTITPEAILGYGRSIDRVLFSEEDVERIKIDYIKYIYSQYGVEKGKSILLNEGEHLLHPNIFSRRGFLIFDTCISKVDHKTINAPSDIAFFYFKLKQEGFIHAKQMEFRRWFEGQSIYEDYTIPSRFNKNRLMQNDQTGEPNRELHRRLVIYNEAKELLKSS